MGVFVVLRVVLGVVDDVGKLRPSLFGVPTLVMVDFEAFEEIASTFLPEAPKRLSDRDS